MIPTTTTRTPKLEVGRERRGYCKPAKRRKTVAQDTASGAMQKEVEVLRVRGCIIFLREPRSPKNNRKTTFVGATCRL